jgi:hypothetical protein
MADNAPVYRAILDAFAASKRQFRLHLRPDDVLAEAVWPAGGPWIFLPGFPDKDRGQCLRGRGGGFCGKRMPLI